MPSRAKTMLVAVKFRKKPVENMLPIVLDLIKQSFVSLFSELGRSWITAKPRRSLYFGLYTASQKTTDF